MRNDFYKTLENEIAIALNREQSKTTDSDPALLAARIVENVERTCKRYGWTDELNTLKIPVGKSMSAGGVQD